VAAKSSSFDERSARVKLSDLSDQQWFNRLSARRNTSTKLARDWFAYYDGEQPLYHVAKLLADQDDRFPALTINWCEKFIDAIDRRCITEGFRVAGADEFDEELWATWVRNDMPEFESENNINSLVASCGYIAVGPSDEGALITVESPEQVAIEIDPRTRKTVASLLFYKSDQESGTDDRAVLQIADERGARLVEFENGKPVSGGGPQKWMAGVSRLQSSPDVPMVRFLNRQRRRVGRSELRSLKPLVDGANLIATHMIATSHHHAMPRMLAINVAESMFFNEDGTLNREAVKQATGAMWIVPAEADEQGRTMPADNLPEVDIKQLPAADLRNFHESLSILGRLGAGLCDLPPSSFGFGIADNPASESGIRAAKEDLTTRIERVHVARGTGYARVMRLAAAVEGRDPAALGALETIWRDPSKPTKSAMADAAVKTYTSGISDLHQAREDYGYSAGTIKAMEERERLQYADMAAVGVKAVEDAAAGRA
jgi:hypothetical protein